jgi:mono/diheme cytochrome c family protein
MKKLLLLFSTVVICILFFYSCDYSSTSTKASLAGIANFGSKEKASIERGEYLAWHVMGCMDCHSKRDFSKFSGPVIPGTEGMGGEKFGPELGLPGTVYGRNITPAGIGSWSDDDVIKAITRGISKNGDTLFPLMPYLAYSKMSKQDLTDIVKYIRTLKPIENKVPSRQLFIPITMAIPPQLPNPDLAKNQKPEMKDRIKYGEYLFTMASCSDCHTPRHRGTPDFTRLAGGGNIFRHEKFTVNIPNITPDTSGIGLWTEKMFLQKFRANSAEDYVNRDPAKFNSYMPWSLFGKMKDEDLKAIYAYLRTLKPVQGRVYPWGS